ncbi:universal stress protein [Sphingomonas hengshuiensis]|uniref:Universal stress protein UspA n=1 Tax=Sphingomonas hengshuiensis TaxID=1609977 RepID=A0A7U4JA55_9SPHN|nr:universal stress protein [Sphingomonas hengshuiensis]AJP73043.1 universal stress protein UspA [Sphingomonas hengshuiensis]
MKNVLLLIHDDPGQEARLQAALDLTRALNGHLVCVDVTIVPVAIDDYVPNGGSALLLADERARERVNRATLAKRLAHEDVSYDWQDVTGDLSGALRAAAGLADVIVINRQLEGLHFPDMRGLAGDLLVRAETPVLAVPETARRFDAFGHALVAWDGSKAAEEALQAAVPLLALARAVTLVEIDDGSLKSSATEAAKYLSRHGIEPVIRHVPTSFERTSDALLTEIATLHPAYLVMGGYGHSRALQAVFGGVTRRMLCESPVPLLLAH